ncbi:Pkinase-domain-containing protein [Teratosphaeria nubilosa]|uniref:non-specific serine/threonine protein kinase n=1 Tax=Teratosphaeria nubilosa TaxID=161662 RepID=A0A6G1KU78_9PEZI|nr:Pkinase-domain-containing protein [Teratosphaeria nubilosa]
MAERYRHNRQAGRRQPLSEIRAGANTPPVSAAKQMKIASKATASSSANHLPHNESLEPNGTLAVRNSQPNSPENKRVSQITSEHERDSKRNSAISTTSTNASSRKRKTYIGHWQLGKTIGKGGCSRVRVVRHRYRDQFGAVKIITRSTAENTRAQSLANLIESTKSNTSFSPNGFKPIPYGLEREIAVMKLLEHPNIVRLYDVWENRNELYLIMEYVDGGELFHYVDQRKGLPEDETVYIFRQIVSALLYCHRLLICHRDLKPENILLNQRDLTVKLIDFGMAALQPEGRLLSTPCGSPHYAAPEVVSSRPYDGTQADVWSCGVILYVMLTGSTPYNYSPDGDIRALFRDIARAKYWMPPDLSIEAKDLIRRIFVPEPKRRITMDEIWDHPLLHKYDKEFGLDGPDGTKEAAIGPAPTIEQWKVKRIQDIDREILRNMRTLWHSEPEQSLIQKLLSNEYNQEKLFYAALVKHREEHLENYIGNADDMEYSASDYHHSVPAQTADTPPLPVAPRSQSQYSIMNDEHLKPSRSFVEPPPSVSSYDPYRASKNPIVNARDEYNVTVHRQSSSGTNKAVVARSLRHPNALRIETIKQNGRRASNQSSSSLPRAARSRASIQRSSMSRNSLTSSMWPSSPPVIASMRPSELHKRGVSFNHLRRASTASAITAQTSKVGTPATPHLPENAREKTLRALESTAPTPSPSVPRALRSRKEKVPKMEVPRIRIRKADAQTSGQHMRSEIRKHSAELEKACEEAFFRDSLGSSTTARTSTTDVASPTSDTPPSSISAQGSGQFQSTDQKPAPRPLPELPEDTPNTYLTKTLEETREKLAAYKASGDDDNTAKFEDVMRMLENIMPANKTPPPAPQVGRRNFTAPEVRTPDHLGGFLPIIAEESSDARSSKDNTNWHRSVTAPIQKAKKPDDKTIRIIAPSSSGIVAPLNVRKRSNGSEASDETQRRLTVQHSTERMAARRSPDTTIGGLTAIDEDTTLPATPTPAVIRKKRSGWFGLQRKTEGASPDTTATAIDSIQDRKAKHVSRTLTQDKVLPTGGPLPGQSSEFPLRKKRFGGGKHGFGKWLGKRAMEKETDVNTTDIGNSSGFTNTNMSLDSLFSTASPAPSSNDGPPVSDGTERSWFARFFNIKPAVRIMCFSIPRGRARQELVILFREWQRHGVRDLEYSRETNTITARVDKSNTLDIKPVTFRVELFVVLEHGKKVGLSIGRFVQVKGAASGFKRVVEVVEGVMRGRDWLVNDEDKWRALCEVVGG